MKFWLNAVMVVRFTESMDREAALLLCKDDLPALPYAGAKLIRILAPVVLARRARMQVAKIGHVNNSLARVRAKSISIQSRIERMAGGVGAGVKSSRKNAVAIDGLRRPPTGPRNDEFFRHRSKTAPAALSEQRGGGGLDQLVSGSLPPCWLSRARALTISDSASAFSPRARAALAACRTRYGLRG